MILTNLTKRVISFVYSNVIVDLLPGDNKVSKDAAKQLVKDTLVNSFVKDKQLEIKGVIKASKDIKKAVEVVKTAKTVVAVAGALKDAPEIIEEAVSETIEEVIEDAAEELDEALEIEEDKSLDTNDDGKINHEDVVAAELVEKIKTIEDMEVLNEIQEKDTRKSVQKAVAKQIELVKELTEAGE